MLNWVYWKVEGMMHLVAEACACVGGHVYIFHCFFFLFLFYLSTDLFVLLRLPYLSNPDLLALTVIISVHSLLHMDTDYLVSSGSYSRHQTGASDSCTSNWRIPFTLRMLPQQERVRIDLSVTAAQSHCLSVFPVLPPVAWQGTVMHAPLFHPPSIP